MLTAKAFFQTPVSQLTPRMEEDFFSSLMTSNKTYKTTFHGRFEEINPRLLQHLRDQGAQHVRILDIGVSSGVSTLELYDDLRAGGMDVTIVATDLLTEACLIRVLPGCYVLVDEGGFPLRFDFPFVTMKPWVTRRDCRNGFVFLRKAINAAFTWRARRVLMSPAERKIQGVKLVTPRLLANADIVVDKDDISTYNSAFDGSFDFIRAANILNKGYFAAPVLTAMVANIGRYLKESSGSLLVVRTHDDHVNHGTLFRLAANRRFEVVCRFGSGSEIEDIVLRYAIPV